MEYIKDGARTYNNKSSTENYNEARDEKIALKTNRTPGQVRTDRQEKAASVAAAKKQAEQKSHTEPVSERTPQVTAKPPKEPTVSNEVREQIKSTIKATQNARDEQIALKSRVKDITPETVKKARENRSVATTVKKNHTTAANPEKVNTTAYNGYQESVIKTQKAVPPPESTTTAYKEARENKFGRTLETNKYRENKPDVPKYPTIDTDKTQAYNRNEKSYQGASTLKNAYYPADVRLMRSHLIEKDGKNGITPTHDSGVMDDTLFNKILKYGVENGTITENTAKALRSQGKDKANINLWDVLQIPQSRAEWLYDSSRTGTMEDILDSKIKDIQNDYSKGTTASAQNALIRYAKDQKGELTAKEEDMLYNIAPYAASGNSIPSKYVTGSVKMSIIPLESEQAREAFADVFVDAVGKTTPALGILAGLSKKANNTRGGNRDILSSSVEIGMNTLVYLAENGFKRTQNPNISHTDYWKLEEEAEKLFPDGMRQLDEFTKAVDIIKAPIAVVDIAEVIDGMSDLHWNSYDSGYIVNIQVGSNAKKTYLCDGKGNIISDISSKYKSSGNEYISEFGKREPEVNISYPVLNRAGETDIKNQRQTAMK